MRLFVFSYNRGPFLANCIDSIERLAPEHSLTVVDDASDDPETLAVLARAAKHHTVVTGEALSGHKHGGLYPNMQAAFDTVPDKALFCFLQDDTQLVRPLTGEDEAALHRQFDHAPTLGFISPAFIRQISLKHAVDRDFRFDATLDLWVLASAATQHGGLLFGPPHCPQRPASCCGLALRERRILQQSASAASLHAHGPVARALRHVVAQWTGVSGQAEILGLALRGTAAALRPVSASGSGSGRRGGSASGHAAGITGRRALPERTEPTSTARALDL